MSGLLSQIVISDNAMESCNLNLKEAAQRIGPVYDTMYTTLLTSYLWYQIRKVRNFISTAILAVENSCWLCVSVYLTDKQFMF